MVSQSTLINLGINLLATPELQGVHSMCFTRQYLDPVYMQDAFRHMTRSRETKLNVSVPILVYYVHTFRIIYTYGTFSFGFQSTVADELVEPCARVNKDSVVTIQLQYYEVYQFMRIQSLNIYNKIFKIVLKLNIVISIRVVTVYVHRF